MKTIEKISFLIFLIGMSFKFLHFPGAPILMLIGIITLISFYTANLLKKNIAVNIIIGLAITFWFTFILFRIQYWNYVNIPLISSLILTAFSIILILKTKYFLKFKNIFFTTTIDLIFLILLDI